MLELQEDLIAYLESYFKNIDFFSGIKIVESNLYNNLLNQEQITIKIANEFEETRYTTLDNAEINNVAVQLNCYGTQKTYSGKKRSAYYMSEVIADLVSKAFDKNLLSSNNENIKGLRKVMTTEPLPLKEGSQVYVTVLRFQLYVEYDYKKIYKGE